MKAETKEKANSVASSENSADEQKISSRIEDELKNVNELLQASQVGRFTISLHKRFFLASKALNKGWLQS